MFSSKRLIQSNRHSAVGLAVLVVVLFTGCGDGRAAGEDGRVQFNPLERDSEVVQKVEAPEPSISVEERPQYQKIIDGFQANALALFEKGEKKLEPRVSQIQSIYLSAGKYLEFVAILQDVVDEYGMSTSAATRLGWAYVRLGQDRQARQFLDRLLAERPNDPRVLVIEGSYWFDKARQSKEAMARATVAWRRVLELQGKGKGTRNLSKRAIRRRVKMMERQLPKPAEEIVAEADRRAGSKKPTATDDEQEKRAEGEEDETAPANQDGRADGEKRDVRAADEEASEATSAADERTSKSKEGRTPVAVLVSRGDLALGEGNARRAATLYGRVLNRRPTHVDARFGLVRARWKIDNSEKSRFRDAIQELVNQDNLTARQAYEIGLFAKAKLGASDLKETLWKRVRQLDSNYADKVGIE